MEAEGAPKTEAPKLAFCVAKELLLLSDSDTEYQFSAGLTSSWLNCPQR